MIPEASAFLGQSLILYLALGSIVGLLAGLLGVGGGLIIVPILAAIFTQQGFAPEIIMHLALGTSLASILATSISSIYSHHQKQAVVWTYVKRLTPGILFGAWCGGLVASYMSTAFLKPAFAIFELLVAIHMLWGIKPGPHASSPSLMSATTGGTGIGALSALVGIGGGTMSVPWLMWYGNSIHKAIGTSAALGFPIALSASLSYLVNGWQHEQLPASSLGYIYLPALTGIILSSVIFAPIGAKLAHRLDTRPLKKIFAGLLFFLAAYLLLN